MSTILDSIEKLDLTELNTLSDSLTHTVEGLIAKLERARVETASRLVLLNEAIANLRALNDAAVRLVPNPANTSDTATFSLCGNDVDDVLLGAEQPMKVSEILEAIRQTSGRIWATSTVYNHLNKSKAKGLMDNADGVWWISEKGRELLVL